MDEINAAFPLAPFFGMSSQSLHKKRWDRSRFRVEQFSTTPVAGRAHTDEIKAAFPLGVQCIVSSNHSCEVFEINQDSVWNSSLNPNACLTSVPRCH